MQRLLWIISVLVFIMLPVSAQDSESDFPEIIGKTIPEATAVLNSAGYQMHPIILNTTEANYTDAVNTVDDFQITGDGTVVQVTVLHEYNLELRWENSEAFANQPGFRDFDGDELFNLLNLSDTPIALRNLQIGSYDTGDTGAELRPHQCVQLWSLTNPVFIGLDECEFIQDIAGLNAGNVFWQRGDSFDIFQNGLYRASCMIADGHCQLWVSPEEIADDIAPYLYVIYNENELIIYNNTENQWMDVAHLTVNDARAPLSDTRNWDYSVYSGSTVDRLAPGQCVRLTQNASNDSLQDCMILARQDTDREDVFWTTGFSFTDTLAGRTSTINCPAPVGDRSLCLVRR